MAHTKSGGSTKLGRDSRSKRLAVKVNHGEEIHVGEIILRQRGTHYVAGRFVKRAGDDSLYAMKNGTVNFVSRSKIRFDRARGNVKIVSITPSNRE